MPLQDQDAITGATAKIFLVINDKKNCSVFAQFDLVDKQSSFTDGKNVLSKPLLQDLTCFLNSQNYHQKILMYLLIYADVVMLTVSYHRSCPQVVKSTWHMNLKYWVAN